MSQANTKSSTNIHSWFIQVVINSDNTCQLLFYLLATIALGVICYHNMILWSHYYLLFNGNSLEKMMQYTMLLVAHLGVFTLAESISIWSYKYLANQLAHAYTKSLYLKTLTPRVKNVTEDSDKFAQITSRDIQTVMQEYLETLRSMVFGLVVVTGNVVFIARQQMLGFLVAFTGLHGFVSVLNNLITSGWSKNAQSYEQAVNELNKINTEIASHKYIKKVAALTEQSQSHSWEAVYASMLEKKRYIQQQFTTTIKSVTEIITRLYNRLQHPLMMGILLYLKRPIFPLKTAADVASNAAKIGDIYQSVQAVVQMRIHLRFFYSNSESNAKRNAGFKTIQTVARKLGWQVEDIQPQRSHSESIWLVITRQLALASVAILVAAKSLVWIAQFYPQEVWLQATMPILGLTVPLIGTALTSMITGGIYAYMTNTTFWRPVSWDSTVAILVTSLKVLTLSLLRYPSHIITPLYLLLNIAIIAGLVKAKKHVIRSPALQKITDKAATSATLKPKKNEPEYGPLDIELNPVKMTDKNNNVIWELTEPIKIKPTKQQNTFLIKGENGIGKSLIIQLIQYLNYKATTDQVTPLLTTQRGVISYTNNKHVLPDTKQTRLYVLPQPQADSAWAMSREIINDYTIAYTDGETIGLKDSILAKLMAYKFVTNPVVRGSLDDAIIQDLLSPQSKLMGVCTKLLKSYGLEDFIKNQSKILSASGGEVSKVLLAIWAAATVIPSLKHGCKVHLIADEPGPGIAKEATHSVYKAFLDEFKDKSSCAFTAVLHHIEDSTETLFNRKIEVVKDDNAKSQNGARVRML